MKAITIKEKKDIFEDLIKRSQYQVGIEFGLDKRYKSKDSIRKAVGLIYKEVKDDPKKFNITQDMVVLVEKSMVERKSTKVAVIGETHLAEPVDDYELQDIKELVIGGSKKTWVVLNKKLDMLLKDNKALKNLPISTLVGLAGMSFDKSQVVKGQATEHISIKAKITKNLSPTERLELVMKYREKNLNREE